MIVVERYHDISCGHRVFGHEGKCKYLHGHNYRITFTAAGYDLDDIGRVIDFSVIKERLCQWLEDKWDHKMLLWEKDSLITLVHYAHKSSRVPDCEVEALSDLGASVVILPFNPTAENMANHLLTVVSPVQLQGTNVYLIRVRVEETRKCSAVAGIV